MSRFISQKTKRIELSATEWIELKEALSYNELLPVASIINPTDIGSNAKIALPLLKVAIVAWNLKDGEGADMPCTHENIDKLDSATVLELLPTVTLLYFPEKKS